MPPETYFRWKYGWICRPRAIRGPPPVRSVVRQHSGPGRRREASEGDAQPLPDDPGELRRPQRRELGRGAAAAVLAVDDVRPVDRPAPPRLVLGGAECVDPVLPKAGILHGALAGVPLAVPGPARRDDRVMAAEDAVDVDRRPGRPVYELDGHVLR